MHTGTKFGVITGPTGNEKSKACAEWARRHIHGALVVDDGGRVLSGFECRDGVRRELSASEIAHWNSQRGLAGKDLL